MLTVTEIKKLQKAREEKQTPDGTPNLYMHTRNSGAANWVCRTTVAKKRVPLTIGAWPEVGGAEARALTPRIVGLLKLLHL